MGRVKQLSTQCPLPEEGPQVKPWSRIRVLWGFLPSGDAGVVLEFWVECLSGVRVGSRHEIPAPAVGALPALIPA